MQSFRRYVAIGDSTTEGLEDPYPAGGYRGWADRLAALIAGAQQEPLEYANLAVRGLRLAEIRSTQLERALALEPDLMSIVGGVNDVIGLGRVSPSVPADFAAMFAAARARGITVVTFTMPDPTPVNPLGYRVRERMFALNDIIRAEADRYGVAVVDFQRYPVAEDRRLWFEDRLHGNALGHERVAAALAWRLGIDGVDHSWAEPLPEESMARRVTERLLSDLDWGVRYLLPWLGRSVAGIPHSRGISAKRPVPALVPPRSADQEHGPDDPSLTQRESRASG